MQGITMRTAGLYYCTRSDENRYTALKRHDNLPFPSETFEGKWRRFTIDEAIRYRVMLDLLGEPEAEEYGQGIPPALAKKVVSNGPGRIFDIPLLAAAGPEIWIGVLMVEMEPTAEEIAGDKRPPRSTDWFTGTLGDIETWVSKKAPANTGLKPVRLFLVNLSRAAKEVTQRALELGLLDKLKGEA